MGWDSYKCFLSFIFFVLMIPFVSYAAQYYDPATKRYITHTYHKPSYNTNNNQMINRRRVMEPILPTHAQIVREKQQREYQRKIERERLKNIRDSSGTHSRRRFDPNRYHRTEEINFSP